MRTRSTPSHRSIFKLHITTIIYYVKLSNSSTIYVSLFSFERFLHKLSPCSTDVNVAQQQTTAPTLGDVGLTSGSIFNRQRVGNLRPGPCFQRRDCVRSIQCHPAGIKSKCFIKSKSVAARITVVFAVSLWGYFREEVTRGYILDADEERYTTRRQKMYAFMRIPRELEKFMSYGFFHCLDSFLFVFTFLPIRFFLAAMALVTRPILVNLG